MKVKIIIALFIAALQIRSQVQYSNSFGNLALQSYTLSGTVNYTTIPVGFQLINDAFTNNTGSTNNPNAPFHIASLQNTGWAVIKNELENDTFLVSTSWLDTTGVNSNRWIITPSITNITATSVLTWLAKSPDAQFADGYEVYGTNKTGVLSANDFTAGDLLFSLADGNTAGGGEKNVWTIRSVSLGAFAGQTLRFAFRNNSKDRFQLWIDDIEVKQVAFALDGACTNAITEKYQLVNTTHTLHVNYTNMGASTINTVVLNYQYGNSSVISQTFAVPGGLSHLQSTKLSFGSPYSFTSPGWYQVKAWPGLTNNSNDANPLNDTCKIGVSVQTTSIKRKVLMEQFVSANDGESIDGIQKALALQTVQPLQNDSIILVNIHVNDSLAEAGTATLSADYKKEYATALVDRFTFADENSTSIDRSSYSQKINSRLSAVSPVIISVINKNYNNGTKQIDFTVKADFVSEVKGDYRMNAYLIENHVHGKLNDTTLNGYNQLNNFFFVPWSVGYHLGYYLPTLDSWLANAWLYKHHRVLIHSFNGAYGTTGTIPGNGGTAGQTYQQAFSYTLPAAGAGISKFNADNIYIVAFVSENNTDKTKREVLNSNMDKLTANSEVVSVKERSSAIRISLYPNPASNYINLELNGEKTLYTIYDISGKAVKQGELNAGSASISVKELQEGFYTITFKTEGSFFSEKVLIRRN